MIPKDAIENWEKIIPAHILRDVIKAFENTEFLTSIRINPVFEDELSIKYGKMKKIPWCKGGYVLPFRPEFKTDSDFLAGKIYPQESSSMIIDTIIGVLFPKTNKKINANENIVFMDLCAAPGGKTLILNDYLEKNVKNGILISNEILEKRNIILKEIVEKWDCQNTIITRNKPFDIGKFSEYIDLMLIDAPCSGEGMARKDPETWNYWSQKNIEICQKRQREIIWDSFNALKIGGYLIYSTCTLNRTENEDIADWIGGNFPAQKIILDGIKSDFPGILEFSPGCYRFLPSFVPGEGFFFCIFQKSRSFNYYSQNQVDEEALWIQLKGRKIEKKGDKGLFKRKFPTLHIEKSQQIIKAWRSKMKEMKKNYLDESSLCSIDQLKYYLIPKYSEEITKFINENLTVTRYFVEIGTMFRKDINTIKVKNK